MGLLELTAQLSSPETRPAAAVALAAAFGADSLLIFVRDREIDAFLSAPGFAPALPNGKRWRAFLAECAAQGRHEGTLPLHSADDLLPAVGFANGRDVVFVLLGERSATANTEWFRTLLPLFAAVVRGEQTATVLNTQAQLARESAGRSAVMAQTLDRTRRQLEDALTAARETRAELEHVNAQLQDHSQHVELANLRLENQAEELEAQALELELQASELLASNSALEEARAVAETADRAKSDFLATMSHELRTPLNAIGGHVQLMELGVHGPLTAEQRQSLARIDRSQRHLLGLINEVLNLARIEAGRVEYVLSDVALSDALADLRPMIEPQLAARSLSLEIRNAGDLPVVRADRDKLQQIFLNLLSNAAKFTDAGGRVWIDAVAHPALPDRVLVRVSDTGIGIPVPKLGSIFEPFTQVDSSHTRPEQGTGLGLAISRDLARGMGGDLGVESELGKGSTFTLTLARATERHTAG
ncbi:MAG: ATP-binding protein [Gemmatimonadaceae bacterium]